MVFRKVFFFVLTPVKTKLLFFQQLRNSQFLKATGNTELYLQNNNINHADSGKPQKKKSSTQQRQYQKFNIHKGERWNRCGGDIIRLITRLVSRVCSLKGKKGFCMRGGVPALLNINSLHGRPPVSP